MVEAGRSVPRRVGIKDVARAAGVSITTVSHVLSDRRPVSRETRERVLAAIEELGYQPNAAAQSLITRRTNTIGLVIPDITNPFYPALAKGMLDVLDPAGYSLMIFSTDGDPEAEARVIDRMLGHGVDGLAFAGYQGYAGQLEKVVERGIPAVAFGLAEELPGIDVVGVDDRGGGRQATEFLLREGRTAVAFVAGTEPGQRTNRLLGYQDAIVAAALEERVVHVDLTRAGGAAAIGSLLDEGGPLDGVVTNNDVVALGVLDGARERGRAVPDELAVIGFDDIDVAGLLRPALTTVRIPASEEGGAAAELLLSRLRDDVVRPPRAVTFSTEVVRRESA